MSQRAQPPTSGTHRPRAPPGAVASAVRPNLFRSQLTRRPTASSSNSADTVRLDVEVLSDSGEIVVRNQQGEIELGDPPTPILETDEPEDRDESEKERQRLAEAVKHHSINHSTVPDQPEELLEAVRASLRAKVAALADDNWMFEAEDQIR
ncbi:hypothetical protein X797_007479 [Metarhizium robertsii]|uniref:Uncharacterized protein n=4 Tax=Metarhizium TaxID=5529 RepID=A0A0D9NNA2_METAN|nr:UPF0220 domain protein [Metarhizium robertsii ARSEF 23]EFY97047.1 UPF0220 domain protein [Metarhizium robertsii ARSEF 23]EXU99344.1 hypothetical protein X797_007479 [Metarhizium robertsii]KJK74075.1 hypothetical protein H634G_10614 [Metarhizium anisopliae BRIP 53293]KJK92603.1 hypothetical protein H633G_03521 [Metarhizium anisopliae BRIP 53284]